MDYNGCTVVNTFATQSTCTSYSSAPSAVLSYVRIEFDTALSASQSAAVKTQLEAVTGNTVNVAFNSGTTYTATISGSNAGASAGAVIANSRFNAQFLRDRDASIPAARSFTASSAASVVLAAWVLVLALSALLL